MRVATKSLALVLTLQVLCVASVAQQRSRVAKSPSPRLTIEASADVNSAKGTVVLKWSLKNNSDKDILVPDVNMFIDHKFVVKDENNRILRLTERGQQVTTASYFTLHRRTTSLASSKGVTKELQISDFYDMKAPGVYTITIERRVPRIYGEGSETIRSNVVRVRIGG